MIVELYFRMLYVLVLCPVLLASAVLTLTIDSQLGTSVEDCFERISIGEQLPRDSIYRNVTELTTAECEQICKQDKQCQAYVYGVGAKGNATCELSNLSENEIKEKNLFQKNPDYDVYVRRFNCEQSAPTPIEQPFESNENGPQHKPVIRPSDEDAKRPLSDDLNPYESSRPQPSYAANRPYKPSYNQVYNDRPDDYGAYKPDNDRPPSYGDHKPHEAPYRPYRNATRPDPYDQLYFQDPHKKPRPALWRPDPYHPNLPGDEIQDIYGSEPSRPQRPYVTEKPQYQYIIRPNRKPYTKPEDQGYYNQAKPEYQKPDPYGPARPNGPIRPPVRPYKPTRPTDKPSYSYTDQYASNYGTNQDNSIYLEIYDPPRPYRPSVNERPYYGAGSSGQNYGQSYGYNSFSNQNSYSQSQLQYGSNSWNYDSQRPQKPTYGNGLSNQNDDIGYGSRPAYKPKPSYGSHSHLSQSSHNQALYDEMYATNQQYYNQGHGSGYGTQVSSTYGGSQNQYQQELHSSSQYGNSQSGYANQLTGYNNRPSNQYGQSGNSDPPSSNYGGQSNQPYESTYGDKNQVTNTQGGYGNQASSSYGGQSNQYGASQESQNNKYSTTESGYGNQGTSSNGGHSNHYGANQDSQSNKYSTTQTGYGNQVTSGYGEQSNQYGSHQDTQNNKIPNPQSGYGSHAPSTGSQSNKYGSNQSAYGNQASNSYDQQHGSQGSQSNHYNSQSGYANQVSNYGESQYNLDYANYHGSHLGYGIHHLYGIKPGSYGNEPDDYKPLSANNEPYEYQKPNRHNDRPNYQDTAKPTYGSQATSGYGHRDKPNAVPDFDRPDLKPVYEQGIDKSNAPGYNVGPIGDRVTSRPVAVGQYGRDPGKDISYEGFNTFLGTEGGPLL